MKHTPSDRKVHNQPYVTACSRLVKTQDNGHVQIINELTPGYILLDLILTNNASLFNNIQSMPPLSSQADHNTIYMDTQTKPKHKKQPPRKVRKYQCADWPNIKKDIVSLTGKNISSLRSDNTRNVEPNWIRP